MRALSRDTTTDWHETMLPMCLRSLAACADFTARILDCFHGAGTTGRGVYVLLPTLWVAGVSAAEPTDAPIRPSERALPSPGFHRDIPADSLVLPPALEPRPDSVEDSAALQVDAITFEGNRIISSAELQGVVQPYLGRRLKGAEIEEMRLRITRYYIGKGYVSSGAVLAPDAYRNRTLTFRIVEGSVEQVRMTGLERLHESYVSDRLSRPDEALNVNVLQERFQRLLADPLFDKINARVIPGSASGQAILDVQVTRASPYRLTVFANNHRSPSVGAEAYGATGQVRNLSGFGDTLDALYQDGRGGPRYGIGWGVPVNRYNTIAEARYDEGRSVLVEEPFNSIGIESEFSSMELGVRHPLIDTYDRRVVVGLSWAQRESKSTIAGEPFSFVPGETDGHSRVWVWRCSLEGLQRWEDSALSARVTFTSGHNNIRQDQAPASAPQRRFQAWLGQLQYAHRLSEGGAQAVLRGFFQETAERLVPLERTSVGGVATVRGYRENQFVRDKGYVSSAELHYPLMALPSAKQALTLIAFVDHGAARNQDEASERLSSVGLGLEGRYQGISGELYFAKRLKKLPNDEGSNLQDKGVHLQVRYDIF